MNYHDIMCPELPEHKNQLIESIITKAKDLAQSQEILTRRQLVDYLNQTHDLSLKEGTYINDLVKEAYEQTAYSPTLQEALVNNLYQNDGKNKVYNPKRVSTKPQVTDLSHPNVNSENIDLIKNQIDEVNKIDGIALIKNQQNEINGLEREGVFSITGKDKVESYKKHAFKIKKGYEKLIFSYYDIKNSNLDLISDLSLIHI